MLNHKNLNKKNTKKKLEESKKSFLLVIMKVYTVTMKTMSVIYITNKLSFYLYQILM